MLTTAPLDEYSRVTYFDETTYEMDSIAQKRCTYVYQLQLIGYIKREERTIKQPE